MARPRVKINLTELEKLYGMQCTDDEVAAFLGISTRTLTRRKQVKKTAEVIDRAKAKGRVSVRRALFRLAASGNVAASIFLAKNLLGYRDVRSNEHSGPDGGPIAIDGGLDLSQFSEEELEHLQALVDKAQRRGEA